MERGAVYAFGRRSLGAPPRLEFPITGPLAEIINHLILGLGHIPVTAKDSSEAATVRFVLPTNSTPTKIAPLER